MMSTLILLLTALTSVQAICHTRKMDCKGYRDGNKNDCPLGYVWIKSENFGCCSSFWSCFGRRKICLTCPGYVITKFSWSGVQVKPCQRRGGKCYYGSGSGMTGPRRLAGNVTETQADGMSDELAQLHGEFHCEKYPVEEYGEDAEQLCALEHLEAEAELALTHKTDHIFHITDEEGHDLGDDDVDMNADN